MCRFKQEKKFLDHSFPSIYFKDVVSFSGEECVVSKVIEPPHEKNNNLYMRKLRRRSASQ